MDNHNNLVMERVRYIDNDHPLHLPSSSPTPMLSSRKKNHHDDDNHNDPQRGREEQRKESPYNWNSLSSTAGTATTNISSSSISHNHNLNKNDDRTPIHLSDAASLIQRAAKSALLDESTPTRSTIFSSDDASDIDVDIDIDNQDYEYDYDNDADGVAAHSQSPSSSPLTNMRSLETPSLHAIPDEQDRKRFVGCLAAVLSSMYDYESHGSPKQKTSTNTTTKINNNNVNDGNDNDVSGFFDFYESSDDDDDDEYVEESIISKNSTTNASLLLTSPSSDTTDNFYSRRCQSFESMGSSTMTMTTTTTTTTTTGKSNKNNSSNNSKSALPHKLKSASSFRRQAANVQQMKSNNNSNINNTGDQKTKISRQRYLSRRYELYSSLLLSSSELLLLEKSTARAFLPMLSRVLVPQIYKTATMTSKQQQQQQTRQYRDITSNTQQKRTSLRDYSFSASISKEKKDIGYNYSSNSRNDDDEESSTRVPQSPDVHLLDNTNELSPFLDSLTPGAGFRCVSLLLLQHLLTSENGYDARIRYAMKKLSVLVLRRDMDDDPVERKLFQSRRRQQQQQQQQRVDEEEDSRDYEQRRLLQATRKYEALEQNVARRLILLSAPARDRTARNNKNKDTIRKTDYNGNGGITREQFVRGVKIGGAGLVAGTLFALTGGLAAPGIAAGVAAFAGAAAGTAAVSALTSAAVVTTIFGVGGGGLAAYKMQRRTRGLTEFEFCRETKGRPDRRAEGRRGSGNGIDPSKAGDNNENIEAELFSILCISGWLGDQCDYQRPWGLQPTHPKIEDRLEKLERFYSIYSPDHVPKCGRILMSWKGEEDQLWRILREKYGRDPDHLFPLNDVYHKNGNASGGDVELHGALTLDQEEILDKLFVELGYHSVAPEKEAVTQQQYECQMSPFEKMKIGWKNRGNRGNPDSNPSGNDDKYDSMHGPLPGRKPSESQNTLSISAESMLYAYESGSSGELPKQEQDEENVYKHPKHLATVWDWKTTYGGEMYTVKWESRLLTQICDCVTDLAVDVVSGATRQILKQTIFHTLISAVIWPSYLLNLANMIDGDWTIAVERADEAGVVLATTLLYSRAGRRPVTLVGYSFGARIIYSCLKELARYQEEWEYYQELLEESGSSVDGSIHEHGRLAKYKQKMKGMREPASIVEDAILLGLPNHLSLSSWRACRQLVAGRLVNCYSNKDLILSLMFQAKRFSGGSLNHGMGSILKPVCGTCPVEEPGVENIDCSDLILGHQDYCLEIGKILERIRFGEPIRCVSEVEVTTISILSSEHL